MVVSTLVELPITSALCHRAPHSLCCVSYYTIYNEKYFSDDHFLYYYNPCPNLKGIKDVLCYKFRRPMIGQNCSAVCTNKGGHRDAFSNERREAPCVSRGLLSRPRATEPRAKRETRSIL